MAPASATVLAFPGRGREAAEEQPELKNARSLEKLKQDYEDYLDVKSTENAEMAEGRRYYHGQQWTPEERDKLKERNQPVVTYNRISRKINGVVGLIEKLRQDPRAFPRTPNPGAADGAELATNVLNYAVDVTLFHELSPECSRHCAIGGISGVELVITQGDQGDPEIGLEMLDQREFFYDPRSTKADFSDCRFMGTAKWVDVDAAGEMWPDFEEDLESYVERDMRADTWRGDERTQTWWTNYDKKRIRIVDHWYKRGGVWLYCIYCGELKLEEGESPFRNEKGESVPKYWAFSANVDHENDRYGFFRDLKSPQDEINHRRSKGLHQLNSRRVTAENGAFDDVEVARREMARSDGFLIKNKGFEVEIEQPGGKEFEGNIALLAEAKQEMENFGPSAMLMGQQADTKGPQSGRAIALLQQAGIAELGPFIIAWRAWKMRVYRALWNAIQQFWTKERWIRVTDDEGLAQFIQVNGWQVDQWNRPVQINQLAALDVDIILDEGPDNVNAMADAFDTLLALAQQGAQVPPEAIIQLSALPSSIKKEILGTMQKAQQDPANQAGIQIKLQQEGAKVGKIQSEAQLNQAKAQQALTPKPETGAGQQIDTPADQAKAARDLAEAHRIAVETAHAAARGPHADQQHELALQTAKAGHEAGMAAAAPGKTMQELAALAAKARLQQVQADKIEAEIADPQRFHPPPKTSG